MSRNKKIFIGILVAIFILYFFLLLLGDFLNSANVYSRMLRCENYLKVIAKAIESYKAEFDNQWPESLEAMEKYYPYNRIPTCPGERSEQEGSDRWIYYYFKPKVEEVVPVCWDSKPHYNTKAKIIPAIKQWNVLYSDGHIERLNKDGLTKELENLAVSNPDVLKVLQILNDPNNE